MAVFDPVGRLFCEAAVLFDNGLMASNGDDQPCDVLLICPFVF